MVGTTSDWEDELGRWLEPFLRALGSQVTTANVSPLRGGADRTG